MIIKKRAVESPPPSSPASGHSQAVNEQASSRYGSETSDAADWRIVEIDGEAAPVYDVASPSAIAALTDSPEALIEDLQDETIAAGLERRRLTVAVDETAIFRLVLLNNGDAATCYEVRVEGWLQEQWVKITAANSLDDGTDIAQLWLQPGERTLLHVAITPARAPASRAGSHTFAIVIRSVQSPHHMARLGAMLTIRPFVNLQLGAVHPQRLSTSWARRSTVLRVPVTNQGNAATEIYVQGQAPGHACRFAFYGPGNRQPHARRITLTLPAGKTAHIITHIMPAKQPLLALRQRTMPIQLAVGLANAQNAPLLVRANLTCIPLFGPWHLLTLLGIVLFSGLSIALVAAATAMLALGQVTSPTTVLGPEGAPATPPVIAVIVQLAQPAPLAAEIESPRTDAPAPMIEAVPPALAQPDPAVPIVQLDQISVPGGPVSQTGQLLPPPTFATRQSTAATMTYQQMFQEIATRYDLNWRMLAAQAYIESSYDTVALNASGAMGIMQIMPGTWREWAPTVNVNDPFDAYSNVMVAAVYLDYLRSNLGEHGHPQMEWMLVAYNWGIDKMTEHLDAGLGWDALPAESRQYALDVLRMAETIPP